MPHCTPWKYSDENVDDAAAFKLFKVKQSGKQVVKIEQDASLVLTQSPEHPSKDTTFIEPAQLCDVGKAPLSSRALHSNNEVSSAELNSLHESNLHYVPTLKCFE